MHALALGAKCGARAASGFVPGEPGALAPGVEASRPSSRSSDARAARPMPLAEVARKLRRQRRACSSKGLMVGNLSEPGAGVVSTSLLYQFSAPDERRTRLLIGLVL